MMTSYLRGKIGNHLFRGTSFDQATGLYLCLFTTLPTLVDGSDGVECSAASYDRVLYGPSDAAWSDQVGGNGEFYNLFSVIFPTPQEDWTTIAGIGLLDADLATGGNMWFFNALASNKNVPNGAPAPEFNPGAIKFTVGTV